MENVPSSNSLENMDSSSGKSFFQRKSPRATFHDYSGGTYFITICTADKKHFFGHISDGVMHYTKIGEYCNEQINELPQHYEYADIPLFVVMPNHLHLIIHIDPDRTHRPCVPTIRSLLSVVIGGLKRAVTMFARKNNITFAWQPRYHDHIIRNFNDGNKIAEYIETNPAHWATDCFY